MEKLTLNQKFTFQKSTKLFRNQPIDSALRSLNWDVESDKSENADPLPCGFTVLQ